MGKLLREEKGSVMVLVAIGLVVILGMAALVVDGGTQYMTKSQLQNAADAAALAGAMVPVASAENEAKTIARANGVDDTVAGTTIEVESYAALGGTEATPTYTEAQLGAMSNEQLIALANANLLTEYLTATTTPGNHTAAEFSNTSDADLIALANANSLGAYLTTTEAKLAADLNAMTDSAVIAYAGTYNIDMSNYWKNNDHTKFKNGNSRTDAINAIVTARVAVLGNNVIIIDKTALINAIVTKLNATGTTTYTLTDANKTALITKLLTVVASGTTQGDSNWVKVTCTKNVSFTFARILGHNESPVRATATATVSTADGVTGAIPVGVEQQSFVYGQTYTLKMGAGLGTYQGNFGGLRLGDDDGSNNKGAKAYGEYLENGYSGTLHINDLVDTKPGNMSGPTTEINWRIAADPTATADTVQMGSPRLVYVPIVDSMDVNGTKPVKIVGFAVFFLTQAAGNGKDSIIYGQFVERVIGDSVGGSGTYYGAKHVALTN